MIIACLIPATIIASINYLMDSVFRPKNWKDNTKSEKLGVILSIFMAFPYVLCSLLGLLLGFDKYGAITNILVTFGYTIPIVAIICFILSFILRKVGKSKASNLSLIIGFLYMMLIIGAAWILG